MGCYRTRGGRAANPVDENNTNKKPSPKRRGQQIKRTAYLSITPKSSNHITLSVHECV